MFLAEFIALVSASIVLVRLGAGAFNKAILLPLLVIAYFALSTFWVNELSGTERLSQILAGLGTAALFVWSWNEIARASDTGFGHAIRIILSVTSVAMVLILLNWAIFNPEWVFVERLRAGGVLNRPNMGAFILSALAVLALWRLTTGPNNWKERLLAALVIGLTLVLILLSGSRGGLFVWAVALALFSLLFHPVTKSRALWGLVWGMVCAAVFAVLIFGDVLPEASRLFVRTGGATRLDIWQGSLTLWLERPVFGHGAGASAVFAARAEHPHSVYLSSLFYGGVIGFLLVLAMLGQILIAALGISERPMRALVLTLFAIAILSTIAHGSLPVSRARDFWLYFWLPLAFCSVQGWHARRSGL